MPDPQSAAVDLGPQLLSVLLLSLGVAVVLGVLVGVAAATASHRERPGASPIRRLLGGPADRVGLGPDPEPPARRFLRICFGLLWIVDGLLQAQPRMPAGFVRMTIGPSMAAGPEWLASVLAPLARAWTRHPVAADAATVWVQVGIGLLLIVAGRRGPLARAAAVLSVVWSVLVWGLGEAFGGLLHAGASFLSGAPGAVLVYAAAGLLLLAGRSAWTSGRAAVWVRRTVAAWMLLGAVLQAVPGEGMWTAVGLVDPFASGSTTPQPEVLRRPIAVLADLAQREPVVVNAVVVVILTTVGIALWITARTRVMVAGLVVCAATWWLAQDFGVLGGTATDPNTALPLGLLLAVGLRVWRPEPAPAVGRPTPVGPRSAVATPARSGRRAAVTAGATALAAVLATVVPLGLAVTLAGPAGADAIAADSSGGLRDVPGRVAPAFTLADQTGRSVSMTSLRGTLVVLTFLDPVCTSDCPLIAGQLAAADRALGTLADRVEFVAVDSNPVFHSRTDVAAFTDSHGLSTLPNWHFLWGPAATLQGVLASYGVSVAVPTVGMVEHTEAVYFLTPDGHERAYLQDGASADLTATYADQIRDEIRVLLS